MQSTNSESPSSSGRTSPESSQPKITHSGAFWGRLPAKMTRSSHQGADGQTLVLLMAPKEQSRGESSTPNISEWPNDAVVCSLSQVLEQTSIPQRFFLSSTACAGILRRADKRGKQLPEQLKQALTAVAAREHPQPQSAPPCEQAATALVATDRQAQTSIPPTALSPCASTRGGMGRLDAESETLLPISIQDVTPREKAQNGKGWNADGISYTVDVAATQGVAQPISLDEEQNAMIDAFGTLKARTAGGGFEGSVMQTNMVVRRLTPVECERLQGFPDNYTNIKDKCPDGPRYKALGNSWAVPVVRWIGERIDRALA